MPSVNAKSVIVAPPDGALVIVAAKSDSMGVYHADYVATQAGWYEFFPFWGAL